MWAHCKACVWEPVLKINLPTKNPQKVNVQNHAQRSISQSPQKFPLDLCWTGGHLTRSAFSSGAGRLFAPDTAIGVQTINILFKGKMYWMHSVSMHGTAASVKYIECTGAVTAAALFIRNPLAARCSWCQVSVQAFKIGSPQRGIQQHGVPKKNTKGFQKAEFQK